MKGKAGDGGKNWLLKKVDDQYAREGSEYAVLDEHEESVASGRTLSQINEGERRGSDRGVKQSRAEKTAAAFKKTKTNTRDVKAVTLSRLRGCKGRQSLPSSFRPQLATLVREPPGGDDWLHELKFDGYRILARVDSSGVRLQTRRGQDWSQRFPRLVEAIQKLKLKHTLLDGEVVALRDNSVSDFQLLQNAIRQNRDIRLVYFVFDIPFKNSYDLTRVALVERKRQLASLLNQINAEGDEHLIRYSDHITGKGPEFFSHACRHALEGMISKRASSFYAQKRSRDWLKIKCLKQQEFVVGGCAEPRHAKDKLGSLLLGYYKDKNTLIYCGRVGTGFDRAEREQLRTELDKRKEKNRLIQHHLIENPVVNR